MLSGKRAKINNNKCKNLFLLYKNIDYIWPFALRHKIDQKIATREGDEKSVNFDERTLKKKEQEELEGIKAIHNFSFVHSVGLIYYRNTEQIEGERKIADPSDVKRAPWTQCQ